MDVHQALSFVDHLLIQQTGKGLSDLERKVFTGSWQGQTYRNIHPTNPEYIEKHVAHTLWKKLSKVLAQRVTKSRLQGAIAKTLSNLNLKRVFISYRGQEPDRSLADQLYAALKEHGHLSFASNLDTIASLPTQIPPVELAQTDQERRICDCFILLISPTVAVSEIAIEELRQLRHWRSEDSKTMPLLIAILINVPHPPLLSHDLRQYLQGAILWQWHSTNYTSKITDAILQLLDQGTVAMPSEGSSPCEVDLVIPVAAERDCLIDQGDTSLLSPFGQSPTMSTDYLSAVPLPPILPGIEIDESTANVVALPTFPAATPATIPSPNPHPLPTAEPKVPKGLVRLASKFYIERTPCESQCYTAIQQPGALIRIKAPRQMGKTSLMARILEHAREQGCQAIPLSFQHADRATFENLGTLLRWFCMKVARKLGIPHRLDEFWVDTFGSKDNCTYYFEEYLLPEIDGPLVLGLDEVDCVFQYQVIADDFFGLLRAWYEEASYGSDDSELWEKLRLVVVHSTEVYIPLDVNQSPFNVGLPIELTEFTPEQVSDLACRYRLNWTIEEVATLMTLVGGHPYLVRLAMYYIAQNQTTLEELCRTAPTDVGIYDDHLRRHLWHLTQHSDLASAYHLVLNADQPITLDSERAFKLHSLGLVRFNGNGVIPSFDLYRHYFRDRLQIPGSPLERLGNPS